MRAFVLLAALAGAGAVTRRAHTGQQVLQGTLGGQALPGDLTPWSYDADGVDGPAKWHTLDAAYGACDSSRACASQSPVDLAIPADLAAAGSTVASLQLNMASYAGSQLMLVNNGFTAQVQVPDRGNTLHAVLLAFAQ